MRVFCETLHRRTEQEFDTDTRMYFCPVCRTWASEEAARGMIPRPYRAAMDLGLLGLLDCSDIHVIFGAPSWDTVEYPRLGQGGEAD